MHKQLKPPTSPVCLWHFSFQTTLCRQQVAFSSPRLETEGVQQCLAQLVDLPIREFVSDQHAGVKKAVLAARRGVAYSYDVWHAAKNVAKRVRAQASVARNKALLPWVKRIQNHFWWCCQNANGSPAKFQVSLLPAEC
ncbi:hypothetical protein FJT64_000064 [Amphibalanus amphitrite]|uniref:Transposase IS204/IS1001/IS1096/IS1165 DDE domain-containing protein n=1 Tax=Amphibalanus amphitrite TaxID=1232801 RepID=A0A6A4XF61_AMPAM|nr:hypothetical protein FJT64_004284 [Amphibalanus amphitrite]KAF0314704.1 hypothetical protein FJT64_000064 [Amphibalanus amphitrite]